MPLVAGASFAFAGRIPAGVLTFKSLAGTVALFLVLRTFFVEAAKQQSGELAAAMRAFAANPKDEKAVAILAANPAYVGQIGTTCVPTMIAGIYGMNFKGMPELTWDWAYPVVLLGTLLGGYLLYRRFKKRGWI